MTRPFFFYSVTTAVVLAVLWAVPMSAGAQGVQARNGDGAPTAAKASVPTPRMPDGHPDLSGLWAELGQQFLAATDENGNISVQTRGSRDGSGANAERDGFLRKRMDPNRPVYKVEFWEKVQWLDDNENTEDSYFHCDPLGVPRMGPPAKIVQTANEVILLYQAPPAGGGRNAFRVIPTDGRPHHPVNSQDQTWMGDSVARWEGDTLVVDVVGFNDVSWLDIPGYFHTTALHVIERFRRDGNTLTYQAIAEDPNVLVKPWVMNPGTLQLNTDPDAYIIEDLPCHERDAGHLVTKEHH